MADQQRNVYERLLAQARGFGERFDGYQLGARPWTGLAILTCMDTRIVVEDIFGLRAGDANVIRNAGALASDDAIRSLILSQQKLETHGVIVLGHTNCGLQDLAEDELRADLARATGQPADVEFGSFADPEDHVRRQVARIRSHPWTKDVPVHGLLFDVATGRIEEVK